MGKLSSAEFHARYAGEKPYFAYWDGEAVQKSAPTRLHSLDVIAADGGIGDAYPN